MRNAWLRTAALAVWGFGGFCPVYAAGPINLSMTTSNGTVPGTAIAYTIAVIGNDGGPRAIFPPGSSDNNIWTWTNYFAEFLSFGGPQTLTVNFSAPVPISAFVFGVNSTVAGSTVN